MNTLRQKATNGMSKFTFSFKALCAAALAGVGAASISLPAAAQPAGSLNEVLEAIRRDSSQLTEQNQRRLREFQQAAGEQEARMQEARAELNAVEARGQELTAQFDANEATLGELQAQLEAEAGDFGELLGQFRQAAGETSPIITNSLANFQYPGRVETLSEIAQARSLPTRRDLDALPQAILQEMVAQSEVTTFNATVANAGPDGSDIETEVLRIGVFTAAITDDGRFVEATENDDTDEVFLKAYAAQPGGAFRSSIRNLISAPEGEVVRAPIDPSKGDLFGIFGNLPDLGDRLEDGGLVGNIILILLAVGAALAIFKIFTLFTMGNAMGGTAKTKQAGTGNPLARVFETYETHKNDDIETLELKLDEQILRETPRIERFNDIVKVLAAVAPLLGLLGTVIGMIITFTAITIYGAGDPQLMAGGISTALMTTVLGLVAAIPLILLHSVASSMARSNQQILDEQAAGLVAERAERSGAAA